MRGSVVKIPGKVMLAGEYSVLSGGRAVTVTVASHLQVSLVADQSLAGGEVAIESKQWESPLVLRNKDALRARGEPLVEAVALAMSRFGLGGVRVAVDAQFAVASGLGSSSALRLGVLIGAAALSEDEPRRPKSAPPTADEWAIARLAFLLQKNDQRYASGFDVATQLMGGLVLFQGPKTLAAGAHNWPVVARRLETVDWVRFSDCVKVFVGGKGAPTKPVMHDTLDWLERCGDMEPSWQSRSEELVDAWLDFADPKQGGREETLVRLVNNVGRVRRLFEKSPHFPFRLAENLDQIPGRDEIWSYKTTGAGGEDAILLVGASCHTKKAEEVLESMGWYQLPVPYCEYGVHVDPW